MAWKERATSGHAGFASFLVFTLLRFFQLVLGLAIVGLYGGDVNNARIQNKYADPKWVYAVVVGSISSVTALVFMVPFIKTYRLFAWDVIVFILSAALFGLFGRMYINEDPEGNGGIMRMKNAVWVDLASMLLWFITSVLGALMFFKNRGHKSLHTGRADV